MNIIFDPTIHKVNSYNEENLQQNSWFDHRINHVKSENKIKYFKYDHYIINKLYSVNILPNNRQLSMTIELLEIIKNNTDDTKEVVFFKYIVFFSNHPAFRVGDINCCSLKSIIAESLELLED